MNILNFDVHSHILPGIDDGAKNVDVSLSLIDALYSQGIQNLAATPHFRSHRDNVADFLERRYRAYELLYENANPEAVEDIVLGAEVAVEYGLSEIEDITNLTYGDTEYILLELPFRPYSTRMIKEIQTVMYDFGLTPVIAHVDRYADVFTKNDYADLFSLDGVIFQVNNEAVTDRHAKRVVNMIIDRELPLVLGSDSHNMEKRKPNFDLSQKFFRNYRLHPAAARFLSIF